jgi:hypothetical protein
MFVTVGLYIETVHTNISVGMFMSYLHTKLHMPTSNHSIFTTIKSEAEKIFAATPYCYFTLHNKLNNISLYFSKISYHTSLRDPKVIGTIDAHTSEVVASILLLTVEN